MIEEIKKYIDEAADKDSKVLRPQDSPLSMGKRNFKAGAESMLPIIELLIEQRNEWSEYAGEYLKNKHLPRDNQEILKLINGGDDEA